MTTFITFLWRGWRPVYTAAHVNALARMLRTTLRMDYELVCVTDDPAGIECETYPLWPMPAVSQMRKQNCYARLRLFDPEFARRFGERIVCLDLDVVILRDLAPLLNGDDFCAVRGISAPLNGSMWMLKVGEHSHVWDKFITDPSTAVRLIENSRHAGRKLTGSDQAWLSLMMPRAPTWGAESGIYQFSHLPGLGAWHHTARAVFFAGHAKPWDSECQAKTPTLYQTYRAALTP